MLLFFILAAPLAAPAAGSGDFPREQILIHSAAAAHSFEVEVASTPAQRVRGLMHRSHLAADRGMLFLYPRLGTARMWMKDTPLSLDMLFIDGAGFVVEIVPRTTPYSLETIASRQPVLAVLELRGGRAAELGIATGDRIDHRAFRRAQGQPVPTQGR